MVQRWPVSTAVDSDAANRTLGWNAHITAARLGIRTKWNIQVTLPSGQKIVTRTYQDFERLQRDLGLAAASLPELPGKGSPGMLCANIRDRRSASLDAFLVALVESCPTMENDEIAAFVDASTEDRIALRDAIIGTPQQIPRDEPPKATPPLAATPAVIEPTEIQPTVPETLVPVQPELAHEPAAAEQICVPPLGSAMDEIREVRRQQWLRHQQTAAAATADSAQAAVPMAAEAMPEDGVGEVIVSTTPTAVAVVQATAVVPAPADVEELSRLCILPLHDLPTQLDDENSRFGLLREELGEGRRQGVVYEAGRILRGAGDHRFIVARCIPDRGVIGSGTRFFCEGPVLPRIQRVQLVGLTQHRPNTDLFREHVMPHFRAIFEDPSRVAIVTQNEPPMYGDVRFHVAALDPGDVGVGIVEPTTEIFTQIDDAGEFAKIHVVPFEDTLPQAYDYDLFQDNVMPFFAAHRIDRFRVDESFVHNGVHFKVVATQPANGARMRVGRSTTVYCEGRLQPTFADLLNPEQRRMLSVFPPGIQLLLLQTDTFGNGDVAERIMTAQAQQQQQSRPSGVNSQTLERTTQVAIWSPEFRERLSLEQTQCIVCLADFESGDEVRHLPCKHVFHTSCIDEWLGRDVHCPLCRTGLDNQSRHRRS